MSKKIAIVAAMKEELIPFLDEMDIVSEKKLRSSVIWLGNLNGREVVLQLIGIGKVNAALAIQNLIHHFNVSTVINVGVAGASSEEVSVGDVVIASKTIQSDFDVTVFGYKKGQIPRLDMHSFESITSKNHIARIKKKEMAYNIHFGVVISADQFVTDRQEVLKIGSLFQALAKDMESAAIGHACYINNTPFAIVRAISDNSGKNAGSEYEDNLQYAIQNAYETCCNLLEVL